MTRSGKMEGALRETPLLPPIANMKTNQSRYNARPVGLYRPEHEHDSCGVGFIASYTGEKSHRILRKAIEGVCNLQHRGAIDADRITGDGAGVVTQIPHKIFRAEVEKLGAKLYDDADLGVGVIFMPRDDYKSSRVRQIVEEVVSNRGLHFFGWRQVPVNPKVLGFKARTTLPTIEHFLIGKKGPMEAIAYERKLFLIRKEIEHRVWEGGVEEVYIPSLSCRTIAYKAFLVSRGLEGFYEDLQNPDFETSITLFHQRYSTNTFPTWSLAQPFRMLAHNGEINTLRGNRNWMRAREAEFYSDCWEGDIEWLKTSKIAARSDSASLDRALEILHLSGRDILHAMTMLVPPAWRADIDVDDQLAAFFEFHRCFNEPWDGPAALAFTDGEICAACLDRNGLRPARYKVAEDGLVVVGSEAGLIRMSDAGVIEKGRLAPGEMLAVDTVNQELLHDRQIKERLAARQPYQEWISQNIVRVSEHVTDVPALKEDLLDIMSLSQQQVTFGCTSEELKLVIKPMIENGMEASGSMGDDTPLAPLSRQPKILYHYFKQLFAQVTNPPIDPIRERLVMSLQTMLGWRRNILDETPEHADLIEIKSPVLFENDLEFIGGFGRQHQSATLQAIWPAESAPEALEAAIDKLCRDAEAAIDEGARILVLSDRGIDHAHAPIPMLMATGAVHHHLINTGKRMRASIICETGDARDVQQIACLVGYGASAVYPYLAVDTIREMMDKGLTTEEDYQKALRNYRQAVEKGLLKVMSKMGISVLDSYRGAEIFEAIGLADEVIQKCFAKTVSQIGGAGFKEIGEETLTRHQQAFGQAVPDGKESLELDNPGFFKFRRNGETHGYNAAVIKTFHTYVKSGKPEDYEAYKEAITNTEPVSLRDLLEFVPSEHGPLPIDEVEPIEDIRRRFTTAAMSLGALSPEAHETLAIAMNRIGGKSNSGEGGEDPARFHREENGDWRNSAIKQVASGRFGVKASYLASAREIEIKMAQGAKPGEGGQLPGFKVNELIARLRCTVPGVGLISPPPHHDIYSIEDLAQLIYDLKQVNPRAKVCVKLVAESGVGTIAAGVAKAHADVILISGHDGGTGAAPLSSIKHAGCPWELGLAETQQVLMINGLRNRITLRTDGGLRTGRDIAVAAILGAEEYNFGSAAMVAMFCVMARQCHLNNCPVGVATQDPKYRAKFRGTPENVIHFFNGVAQEVREIMAFLGVREMNELIGRPEYLRQMQIEGHSKSNTVDLSGLLKDVVKEELTIGQVQERSRADRPDDQASDSVLLQDSDQIRYCTHPRNELMDDDPLDNRILQDIGDSIAVESPIELSYHITNVNRSIGTKLSGEIGYQKGQKGLPANTIKLHLDGSAGQSLGTFLTHGVNLYLTGEANDYVGKGMDGGKIVVVPPRERKFTPSETVIVGNTVLYGATGGQVFVLGKAGERLGVRNSGAVAVVEGAGDHCCEYMTGGTIVVLGKTGKNFGAGMTGGKAFVLDESPDERFSRMYNPELIQIARLSDQEEINDLKGLIYQHLEHTESERANEILQNWSAYEGKFWKIFPKESSYVREKEGQGITEAGKEKERSVPKKPDTAAPATAK